MSIPSQAPTYELGPIRPPSEATSLLLRVTRNCPWNKCAFCSVYKGQRFSKRSVSEIKAEIDLIAKTASALRDRFALGPTERLDGSRALEILRSFEASVLDKRTAMWLERNAAHVFLQDADSMVILPAKLKEILEHLKERLPTVTRVTTYARSRTLVARSSAWLRELKKAGLTRIHIGLESGSDRVLEMVSKGCRLEHHIDGARRAVDEGFEVCCYVMPGLGGRALSLEHAEKTAEAISKIGPGHLRLRTLWIDPGSPLHAMYKDGRFEPLEEHEVIEEIRAMIASISGEGAKKTKIVSDHDRNLLVDVEGDLSTEREKLLGICDRFLNLEKEARDGFVAGRRAGLVSGLHRYMGLSSEEKTKLIELAKRLEEMGHGSLVKGMMGGLRRRSI